MKKAFLAAFLALCLATFAQAQQTNGNITAAGTTCTAGVCVQIIKLPPNSGAVSFSVSGTFSATLQFEVSADGAGFVSVNAYPPNSSTAVTSTTSAGTWTVSVAGMTSFRVRGSAYASGSAGVVMNASSAVSASSLTAGGGGGGGGVDSVNGQTGVVVVPVQTTDASTVPEYAPAIAIITLSSAQLNALGATPISVISAPGSGKIIVPTGSIYAEYVAGATPFGAESQFSFGYSASLAESFPIPYSGNIDFTNAASQFAYGVAGFAGVTGAQSDATNTAFYVGLTTPIGGGPIATSTLDSGGNSYTMGDTGTVSGGGNGDATYVVDTISAGNGAIISTNPTPDPAGSGYAVNDTGVLTHGDGTAAYIVDSLTTTGAISMAGTEPPNLGWSYAVGDTGTVTNGISNDATYIVDSLASETITGVNSGAGGGTAFFSIGHSWDGSIPSGTPFTVTGSTGNDGSYTVYQVAGGSNLLPNESIVSPIADGVINIGEVGSFTITAPGSNYSINGDTTATGGAQPGIGSGFIVNVTAISPGVAAFHLTSNGSGYSVENSSPTTTGGAQPGSGTGFAIDITAVNSDGVATYHLTSPGTNYTSGTGIATSTGGGQPGSGSGFTLNVGSVTQGNGSATAKIPFIVVPIS